MKIVVTGSKGFIGKTLVKQLLKLKHEVVEIDLGHGHDVGDWQSFKGLGKFDYLIHLAAKIFVPDSFKNPRSFYSTNLTGTLNALEACRLGNARLIYFSSYIYGKPKYLPIDEKHPINSFNPYSHTKIMSEDLCQNYYSNFGVKSIIFRPFNIYGPFQDLRFLIPSIINQATNGKIVLNDHRPKRDYVFVDDIINAIIKSLDYESESVDIFNLGSGESFSVEDVASNIIKYYDKDIKIEYLDIHRPNEILDTTANINKASSLLNWRPEVSFQDGIEKIVISHKQSEK